MTSSQTLRSVATMARNRATDLKGDAESGRSTPSSSVALDQIASDLDAAAAFIGNSTNLAHLSTLLAEVIALADVMELDYVAAHANEAVESLRSGEGGVEHGVTN